MPLQTSGKISISDIATEFLIEKPLHMSKFYGLSTAPSSGHLKMSYFYGLSNYSIILQTYTFEVYTTKTSIIPIANILDGSIDEWSGNNDPLTIISVQNAINGSVSINGSNIEFTSTNDIGLPASFEYTVRNSQGILKNGSTNMNVVDIPPIIANPDTYDLQQSETLLLAKDNLSLNDEDGQGLNLSVVSVKNPVGGTVYLNGNTVSFESTGLSGQPASFEYIVTNGTETQTGKVYINVTPLPEQEFFLYQNTDEAMAAVANTTPPTVLDIFNTWARFNGSNYYADKDAAIAANDSNATAWQFLTNPDRVSMPLNVDPSNGFISPDVLDNYTFEATLTSTSSDNDSNGLVVAFHREGTTNHVLALMVSCSGSNPIGRYALVYFQNTSTYADTGILASSTYLISSGINSWSNNKIRLKIQRQGNIIKCYGTNWNDTDNYQISSEIVFDLSTNSNTTRFTGLKPYGYMTFSQPYSTYLDISFNGGAELNKVFDAETGKVWEFIDGQWVETNRSIQDDIGYIRKVTNPETNQRFIVKENTIEYLGTLVNNNTFDVNKILENNQIILINSIVSSSGAPINDRLIGLYESNKEETNLLLNAEEIYTNSAFNGYSELGTEEIFNNNGLDVQTLRLLNGTVVFASGVVGKITNVSLNGNVNIYYSPTTDYKLFDKTI